MSPTLPNQWRPATNVSRVLGWRIGTAGVFFLRQQDGPKPFVLRRTTIAGSNAEETEHESLESAVKLSRTLDHIEESRRRNAEHQVSELLATPDRIRQRANAGAC